jgi:FdhD protein
VTRTVARRPIVRVQRGGARRGYDTLVAEEPLEIRVGGTPLAVTMRTPGHDFELAAGFVLTEGVVGRPDSLRAMRYCAGDPQRYNVLDVELADGVRGVDPSVARNFYTTSSCGLCGKASIDAVRTRSPYSVSDDPLRLSPALLAALPVRLREGQRVFRSTGGLHAAGLFDATGELVCLREDVGRHNAFDKVIGWAALEGRLPLRSHIIVASGRAGFELVQKALMAGIPALAAVSAPSNLAVELAEASDMTLVGFLRGDSMNVYAGDVRIAFAGAGDPAAVVEHD